MTEGHEWSKIRIAVGSDERTGLTDFLLEDLEARGFEVVTHGALTAGEDSSWPVVAQAVTADVVDGRCSQGILLCWTGTGVSMAANKVPGVRAALCTDAETAKGARLWNDANVLCMSLRLTSFQVASEILNAWLDTPEPDEDETGNIEKLKLLDSQRVY